jgi:hypothetical protein
MFCDVERYPVGAERDESGTYVDGHLQTLWLGFRTAYIWARRWWRDDDEIIPQSPE